MEGPSLSTLWINKPQAPLLVHYVPNLTYKYTLQEMVANDKETSNIWLERNCRLLRNISREADEVAESVFWTVSKWASRDKEFLNISLHDLVISWPSCFQGVRYVFFVFLFVHVICGWLAFVSFLFVLALKFNCYIKKKWKCMCRTSSIGGDL